VKFSVVINGKKYPVQVMKEPNNASALSNFELEGRTYKGLPEQFNGLRFDKKKEQYTAISIIVTEPIKSIPRTSVTEKAPVQAEETVIEIAPVIQNLIPDEGTTVAIEEESIPVEEPTSIEITSEENNLINDTEVIDEDDDQVDDVIERKQQFLANLEAESKALHLQTQKEIIKLGGAETNGFKKLKFYSRIHDIFPDNISYGEGLFEKQKTVWIRLYGSEHLKMAHDMQSKCDSLYIQERAMKEFPNWEIHELLVSYEIDSPDYGILTFLKNFKKMHQSVLDAFHSKVSVDTTNDHPNEEDPVVVISNYLGHCDLSIPLVNLVDLYGDRC
jgi:hypothetical protein